MRVLSRLVRFYEEEVSVLSVKKDCSPVILSPLSVSSSKNENVATAKRKSHDFIQF